MSEDGIRPFHVSGFFAVGFASGMDCFERDFRGRLQRQHLHSGPCSGWQWQQSGSGCCFSEDRTRITSSLKLRLDRAYIYAAGHRNVKIVVSGGQGRGEDIPEAEAMKEYLVGRGIERERIFPEDRSSTTEENLRFTARLIPDIKEKKTGVVTNSFHIYRAWLLGKREGYQRLFPVSAKSEPVLYLNYMVREALAVLFLPGKGWRNRH